MHCERLKSFFVCELIFWWNVLKASANDEIGKSIVE